MNTTTPLTPLTWEDIQGKLGLTPVTPASSTPARPQHHGGGTIAQLMAASCRDGERTSHLTQLAGALLAAGYDPEKTISQCHAWNQKNTPPLDPAKIESTCRSIAQADARKHPLRHNGGQPPAPFFDLKMGRIDRYISTAPAPRRWLLKELVVLGKAGAVIAPGGSSKSQWLLQLAVGVATGIPVADHWAVGETGSVIVFFAEDDEDEIHRRLKRIHDRLTARGQGKAMQGLENRLYVLSTIGKNMLLTRSDANGEVVTTPVVDCIADLAKQLPDLRLIVIDPASRFRGGEENSNEDATRFVEALETLAKATGASVMLAHHTNKGSYSADGEPGQGASRGASALTDGLRWQMNLNRPSDRQAKEMGIDKALLGKYVTATVTKTNYSGIPEPVLLERLEGGYLTVVSAIQAKNQAEMDAMVRILQMIEQAHPMAARELEDRYGGLKNPLKMAKQRVREVARLAVEKGLLTGGDREKLQLTDQGKEVLRCAAPPALAMSA